MDLEVKFDSVATKLYRSSVSGRKGSSRVIDEIKYELRSAYLLGLMAAVDISNEVNCDERKD